MNRLNRTMSRIIIGDIEEPYQKGIDLAKRADAEDWITSPYLSIADVNTHPLKRRHSDYKLRLLRKSQNNNK